MKKKGFMPDLKVEYCLPNKIDSELDKQIEKFFETVGYKRYASGYSHVDGYRDLAFDCKPILTD